MSTKMFNFYFWEKFRKQFSLQHGRKAELHEDRVVDEKDVNHFLPDKIGLKSERKIDLKHFLLNEICLKFEKWKNKRLKNI